jgi:hypothetical protein
MVYKLVYEVGRYKLGWFKSDKSLSSLYFNTNFFFKIKKSMFNKLYVVINWLIKSIRKDAHLENSFDIYVKGKNINPTKNDWDKDF